MTRDEALQRVYGAFATAKLEYYTQSTPRHLPLCYFENSVLADAILDAVAEARVERDRARPLSEWHEDFGDALWWFFPISEPPYLGSPLWSDWPGYHTHWTRFSVPIAPDRQP